MDKQDENFFSAVGGLTVIILIIVAIPVNAIFEGFVVVKLWSWFVTPIFGLPLLGIAQAVGIVYVAHLVTNDGMVHHPKRTGKTAVSDFFSMLGRAMGRPAFFLLFGYITYLFT